MPTESPITKALIDILSNSYALLLKTQNFHWNVTGKNFYSLHKLFEEQYTELFFAVDELAERIKALNTYAPGAFSVYLQHINIKEAVQFYPANKMLEQLYQDHNIVIKKLKDTIKLAEQDNDQGSVDLLSSRLRSHEKQAWILFGHTDKE